MNEPSRPRVLHIFGRLNRGGAELRTLDLLRQPACHAVQLKFGTLSALPGDLDREVVLLGGEVHPCPLRWNFAWEFGRLLQRLQIDAVHSHVQLFSGFILGCAARVGIPTRIAHFRSVSSGHPASWRRCLQNAGMRRALDRWATLILGNGEASLSHGWNSRWPEDPRCAVLHNGLDAHPFRQLADPAAVRAEFGWPNDCPLMIHVGRMDPAKNHLRLVDIMENIARRQPVVRFLLVGRSEPVLRKQLSERLHRAKLEGRVAIAGLRSDVPRLLQAADVMLFPSQREGLPGAVLEAVAAGTPVVASDLPGIQEISRRFATVECLSLSVSDEVWAEKAIAWARRVRTAEDRVKSRRELERSVYGIDRCVTAHLHAWSGASGREIRAIYQDHPRRREVA